MNLQIKKCGTKSIWMQGEKPILLLISSESSNKPVFWDHSFLTFGLKNCNMLQKFPTFHTSLTHLKCNLIKSLSCLKHINGVALADPSFHFFHSHYLLRANMCSSMEHKVLHNGVFLNGNSLKNTFFSSNIDYSQLS